MGIDASTSTIGIGVFEIINKDIKIKFYTYYKPSKEGTIFERLSGVRKFMIDLIIKQQPDKVVLEDIVLFMPKKSTAQTITILAAFNRTVGTAIYDAMQKSPILLSSKEIRDCFGYILPRAKKGQKNKLTSLDKKKNIKKALENRIGFSLPDIISNGKIKLETYDISDAFAAAYAGIFLD